MAGGTFTSQNKVIPGAYINFSSESTQQMTSSSRGVSSIPLELDWGPKKEFVLVDKNTNFKKILGHDINSEKLLLIKEMRKRAKQVLVYRVNSGIKASATLESLVVTAKYEGTRGNSLTISIAESIDVPGSFIVKTYLDNREVDEQLSTSISNLKANDYVVFSGEGSLQATAGINLTGGTETSPTIQDYTDYMEGLEIQDFNTFGIPKDDATIKAAASAFVKRMIETEGKSIQVALPNYIAADYEGVISVKNGVFLSDGTHIDKVKAVAWVAGATAGADINEDLTYSQYEDAVDVDERYTKTQIADALNSGEFLFIARNQRGTTKVLVQDDTNTFRSYTSVKNEDYSSNRKIRTMSDIRNTVTRIWEESYIGKVDAINNGADLFKGDLNNYFIELQKRDGIKNFDANIDIEVIVNPDDTAYVNLGVDLVGSFKKLYMQVRLQ